MSINLQAMLTLNSRNFTSGMNAANRSMKSMRSSVGSLAAQLGVVTTVAGAVGVAVSTVNKSIDFESQLSKVGAIAGASANELEKLKASAMQLGADTTKGASEVAMSMSELAAKGFDANKIIGAMPGIIKAAEASGTELATTSDVITSALNAFNMKAEASTHIADVMAMAANQTAAGVEDMGFAFKYAAPVANALGINLEELAASTGLMVDKGLAGEQAGTALRMGLMRLSDAPKEASKAMDAMGFSAIDSAGKFKSISTITDELRKKTKDMSEAQKVQTMSTIFGTEAATGWLGLIDSAPGKIKGMTDALVNSNGVADETAQKMLDNSKGAIELLKGSVETLQIKLGDALLPTIKEASTEFAGWLDNLKPETIQGWAEKIQNGAESALALAIAVKDNWPAVRESIVGITAAVVTYKGAMAGLMIIGSINQLMTLWKAGTLAQTFAQYGLNTALTANPIGVVVMAIAALVAGGILLYRNWDTVKKKTLELWNKLGVLKGAVIAMLGPFGQIVAAGVLIYKNFDTIKAKAGEMVNSVVTQINRMIDVLNKIPGVNIPIVPKVDWSGVQTSGPTQYGATAPGGYREISAAGGLSNIRRDGTLIRAHRGERVLNKFENEQYSSGKSGGNTYHFGDINIQGSGSSKQDAKRLLKYIADEIEMAGGAGA